jgi:hypothetical protein
MGLLVEQQLLVIARRARRDRSVSQQVRQLVFLAIGEHFQRRLGLGLNVENPFHGAKRERPVAQRPLQGVDQIAVVVVSPQGQNLAALRFTLAMGLQQPFEKTLSDRAELGEAERSSRAAVRIAGAGRPAGDGRNRVDAGGSRCAAATNAGRSPRSGNRRRSIRLR